MAEVTRLTLSRKEDGGGHKVSLSRKDDGGGHKVSFV